MDEHSELQLEFNSQDRKLKELQQENDRLVIYYYYYLIVVFVIYSVQK